ncbi:MAG: transcription-repair coupling factor [Thiotrichales bacterium]|jgi:transcription-repair coupling factor (superfamily II helicase)|nr:transcription-repair coupling factor [Thiotrichales bacterium]MBT5499523.1 transcription-repair coupling factor [Thiotrichales bacterium]MBT7150606.1 transcription-repair coupling factor [Thiotrichales bacterium]MBT7439055.1 transcription-repair coupling factor [Thiotrichales bacterium]
MSIVYPQESGSFSSDLKKNYWGSLFGSSEALALTEFAESNKGVVLYIARDIAHHDEIKKALLFFKKSIKILDFSSWEVLAFDHFSPHPDIVSSRIHTLSKLSSIETAIVVTTVETLSQRLCPKDYINKYSLNLKTRQNLEIDSFTESLIKIGYRRVTTVMEPGEFSLKGALIDLYPMGAANPYRIDLFDNEIDSIRSFDPSTQRSIDVIEEVYLLPAREFASDNQSINIFKKNYLSEFGSTDGFIYTEVSEGRYPGGIEFYLPLFFDRTDTLFDYIPNISSIVYQKGLGELLKTQSNELLERFEYCQNSLERLPLPINKVFLDSSDFFSALNDKKQIQIQTSKIQQNTGLNFSSSILPPLKIEAQAKKPLNKLIKFIESFRGRVLIVCESDGRQSVLVDLLSSYGLKPTQCSDWIDFINQSSKLCITSARLNEGVVFEKIAIISENNLFGKDAIKQQRRRRAKHKDFDEAIKSLVEIQLGDPVVHEHYGIGRYLGLESRSFDENQQDFLSLEYANGSKLMVPITNLNLISRYSGASSDHAPLHKLGSQQWTKAKRKAAEALYDVAAELLEIYAKRQSQKGFSYPAPNDSYSSFVSSFKFEETPDQLKTMNDVLLDMQSDRPMDRLVCGDVGFGKTEIAMRAAFLAVESGKQVAILVPTTLLANQHYQTFNDRFSKFPIVIKSLSRFQDMKEQKQIKMELKEGKIDIVIGTHKLIQGDIKYQKLGLIIIDEEHRFGVKQKESLKKIRGQSDILTMTATPIPRSLNMALGSLRELSIIASPPAKRTAIQTFVDLWDDNTIIEACSRELHRGGQIFVVHNEIDTIDNMAESFKALMPNLKIRIAHGQMPSKELEQIMTDFYHQRFQVLVCTTIIETGIDIPSANTIIINNAQNFGLAQLHQLRGRVGRSHHKAYAYLVIKSHQSITQNAKKRLDAIASLEELGAGFMLANHDLEIRGAGDLLGENQSGKISEIGFNLYHDLLKRTIHAIKNNTQLDIKEALTEEVEINPGIACIIPDTYLPDVHERLILYKRIASANNEEELKDLKIEMIDRFGALPDSTSNLFESSSLKNYSNHIGVLKINIYDDKAEITLNEKNSIDTSKIINLIQTKPTQYQLKNQNTIVINESMEPDMSRISKISKLLSTIA